MRKFIRTRAAQKVVDRLIPSEAAVEEALANVTKLLSASIEARMEAQLPISTGRQAINGMSSVVSLITRAREELIIVHEELAETKILIGLREVSYGDLAGCPPVKGEKLSLVSEAV